jgi:hypothetical protein
VCINDYKHGYMIQLTKQHKQEGKSHMQNG